MEQYILAGATMGLGVIGTLLLGWKTSIERRQALQEKEMKEIKTNYIARFEDVKETINIVEKNILVEISKVNVTLAQGNRDTREYRKSATRK